MNTSEFGAALVASYPELLTAARRFTRTESDARDLRQDVVLKALDHRDSYEVSASGSFQGWLYTILRNHVRDVGKHNKVMAERKRQAAAAFDRHPGDPEIGAFYSEIRGQVERLPAHECVTMKYVCFEGHDREDVAALLGASWHTVNNRLRRARERLVRLV